MGNSLRSCLACVLPCGALDLIRIIHSNGYLEELTGPITVGEVLKVNPNYVLTKPNALQSPARRILILSRESKLKRGSIYFLIPTSSLSGDPNIEILKEKTGCSMRKLSYKTAPKKKTSSLRLLNRNKSSVGEWSPHLERISEDM